MTDPSLATGHSSFLDHVRAWFARDVEPDITDLKVTAAKVRELAPALGKIANAAALMAKVDPGLPPTVVAEVEEAATVVARIAAELAPAGM